MRRLEPAEAAILAVEGPRHPMTDLSIGLLEGAVPSDGALADLIEERMLLAPWLRHRLATVPLRAHRPVFVPDEGFDLRRHVHRIALGPAAAPRLTDLAARLVALPFDRSRPLWDLWVVEGLGPARFAILTRSHRMLGAHLLDFLADPRVGDEEEEGVAWGETPRPPSALELLAAAVEDRMAEAWRGAAGLIRAASVPPRALRAAARRAAVFAALALRAARPPAGRASCRRSVALARGGDLAAGARPLEVAVAAVAAVAAGFRRRFEERGREPEQVRAELHLEDGQEVLVDLPVAERDPRRRLDLARTSLGRFRPLTLYDVTSSSVLALATYLEGRRPPAEVTVHIRSSPPGPSAFLGRRIVEHYDCRALDVGRILSVAVCISRRHLTFGIVGDRERLPDVDRVARGIAGALVRDSDGDAKRPELVPIPYNLASLPSAAER